MHRQAFTEALLAVAVFRIKIGFSDNSAHLQDKRPCKWESRGGRGAVNLPGEARDRAP